MLLNSSDEIWHVRADPSVSNVVLISNQSREGWRVGTGAPDNSKIGKICSIWPHIGTAFTDNSEIWHGAVHLVPRSHDKFCRYRGRVVVREVKVTFFALHG